MFLHKVNGDLLYLPPQLISPDGEIGRRTAFRWQRSKGCAGSNPVLGTLPDLRRFFSESPFLFSSAIRFSGSIAANKLLTLGVRTTPLFLLYRIPSGNTRFCKRCLFSNDAETQATLVSKSQIF